MIDNLLKLQDTWEFQEYGYIDLIAVQIKESHLELKCQIYKGIDDEPAQLWQIVCHEIREHKVSLGEQDSDFMLFNDHVLLWSYNQPVSSLTFNRINSVTDTYHVVGKLYEKHQKIVNTWIPFYSCFNQSLPLETLINLGYGKLAEGAEKIIIGYQEVMNECGFKSSYLSRTPKRWDDEQGWIDENSKLQILITENSYIIASNFTADKIVD